MLGAFHWNLKSSLDLYTHLSINDRCGLHIMLFDPRHATGPNATGLNQPDATGLNQPAISYTKLKKQSVQEIPGVNKVPPGQGWWCVRIRVNGKLMVMSRSGMGEEAASSRISGSPQTREEK